MDHQCNLRALYIVVDAGFAEQIVSFIRSAGVGGATIINSRGVTAIHKEIIGISTNKEKEIILTVCDHEVAQRVISSVKQKQELKMESHVVCFALPVIKAVGLTQNNQPMEDIL